MHRPIRTRGLKKADFEADFFFIELVESGLHSTLRHLNTTARQVMFLLINPPITCQQHSFESMENLLGHLDRVNKMESPQPRFASPMSNQQAARQYREALQIAITSRLVCRDPYGVRTRSAATAQPPGANWSLIMCYENFFQQCAVNE